MKFKCKPWEIALALALVLSVLTGSFLEHEQEALADSVLRLHVLANSDSPEDQALKLVVRDAILEWTTPLLYGVSDRVRAEEILCAALPEVERVAEETIRQAGYLYAASAELAQTAFPTKTYTDFALPAGRYEALRVVIGDGGGQNWWCVVFPPLCLAASGAQTKDTLREAGLTDGQVSLVTGETEGYEIKFKCLEWWDAIKHFFGVS